MALTIAASTTAYATPYGAEVQAGPYKHVFVSILFDSSYPTGGESVRVTGSPIDSRSVILGYVNYGAADATSAAFIPYYDPVNEKIIMMKGASGVNVQVADTADLSAVTLYGYFITWG